MYSARSLIIACIKKAGAFSTALLSVFICLSFLAVSFLISATAVFAQEQISFPGKPSEISSPNNLYVIRNVEERLKDQSYPANHLVFENKKEHKKTPLRMFFSGDDTYQRNVGILWSPNSDAFVVNDWYGSDRAEAYLFRVTALGHPINLSERLTKALREADDIQSLANIVHSFIIVSKFANAQEIEIILTGNYTSKPEMKGKFIQFTSYYSFDTKKNLFTRVKRVNGSEFFGFKR